MNDEKKSPKLDASYFLDEHGILMADKMKEYEDAQKEKKDEDE